jgi:hypothetical protein
MTLKQRYIRLGRKEPNRMQLVTQTRIPNIRGMLQSIKSFINMARMDGIMVAVEVEEVEDVNMVVELIVDQAVENLKLDVCRG